MNNYDDHHQYYRIMYKFVIDLIRSEVYGVRVSYTPQIIAGFINSDRNYPTLVTFSAKYNTPYYSTANEAIAHAKGWVDCMEDYYSCNQTDPDENEDSYKNAEEDAFSIASEKAVELAYETGWEKKLSELKILMER